MTDRLDTAAVLTRLVEVIDAHDWAGLPRLLHPDFECRLVHTGEHSMHISVHVRSGDPRTTERELTTHCLLIFVGLGEDNHPVSVPVWEPVSDEDVALEVNLLAQQGMGQVVVVDLTKSEFEIPVVRALVPGLECYISASRYQPAARAAARLEQRRQS